MKKIQLRSLIREEIQKVLKEIKVGPDSFLPIVSPVINNYGEEDYSFNYENIFKNSDAFDRLFLKTIIKCGNENETQNNKTLCEHLDCKYNENKNATAIIFTTLNPTSSLNVFGLSILYFFNI